MSRPPETSVSEPQLRLRAAYSSWRDVVWLVLALGVMCTLAAHVGYHWHRDHTRPSWPFWSGVTGLLLILAMLVVLAMLRRRTYVQVRHYLRAVESLHEVSTAISSQLGQGPKVLQQVTDTATHLLGMSMASINLLSSERRLCMVAASGSASMFVGRRWSLDDLRLMRRCVAEGRTIWASDVEDPRVDVDRRHTRPLKIRCMLAVPMRAHNRIIGALVVADDRPRVLSVDTVRLAELWASQAAVIIHNNELYQRMEAALQQERRVQAHRDLLLELSSNLYERLPLDEALQRMTERGPAVLGVDIMTIALREDAEEVRVIASTTVPSTRSIRGRTFNIGQTRPGEALRKRQIVTIEDAAKTTDLDPRLKTLLNVGAVMFVPLIASGNEPFGLISLIRHQPGPFSDELRQTAVYLADRAAAAIEAIRLHEQAKADAQTKTMLLRELHHRVKNSLAGIVSLLSINQPLLPPDARQWLDRAITRIGVMARAHELFSATAERLNVNDVIRTTISSLSVVLPPGVQTETDVCREDLWLSSDRGVALAMVLHELMHNAIVHGTQPDGRVAVRCSLEGEDVVIQVADRGRGQSSGQGADPAEIGDAGKRSSGVGLGLVRGLVERELGGWFQLEPNANGGMTATVRFSLDEHATRPESG